MKCISVRLPEALHKQVKLNCVNNDVTINSFIVSAVSNHLGQKSVEDVIPAEENFLKEER